MGGRSLCHRRVPRARGILSRTIGWAVASAIVLQLWAGGPLAARMAMEVAAAAAQADAHCMPSHAGHGAPHDRHDGPPSQSPPSSHEHQTCLLCQGALGPLFLLAAVPPSPPRIVEGACGVTWTGRISAQQDVHANAPRAPPLTA